jgi:EF-P beta-lysylation protein EpmB
MNGKTPAMIPRLPNPEYRPAWQSMLAEAVKSTDELLRMLEIDPASLNILPLASNFPLRVPRGFVRRMAKADINDPLLRQVLPLADEMQPGSGYLPDPLDEQQAMQVPGLLQKYRGRALLTTTGACAVHCRYCFRRHFPYSEANPASEDWEPTINWLKKNPDIREIILSGGDPLSLPDSRLHTLSKRLDELPWLNTLRIHTRLPVVLPERIDEGFLSWVEAQKLQLVMVVHSNHPNEIDATVSDAMNRLKQAGVTLLNQSVLLRGINDSAAILVLLSEVLFSAGVLPYYLHQLDRVQGAAHFEVNDATAMELMEEVRAALPGYLVPRLVRELPGEPGKTVI